ncbi:MAG: hypothetical protein KAW89_08795, partial [Armatimonadetes bacterium]|nr:hypothetical protein [Armatimonadota bacterium]
PRAREIADGIQDDFGNPVNITWCVRSDLQMKEIYGDCAWPYTEFRDLWQSMADRGDEIAWHPHLWRWSDEHGCWYQEISDETWIRDCLQQGHAALSTHLGCAPTVSRMGWEFHNDTTMQAIDGLGVKVDFSAVPGRFTPGSADHLGSVFNCYVDWRNTPERAYVPSASDYRREPKAKEEALGVTELPMSTFRSRLLAVGARLRRAAKANGWDRLKQLFSTGNGHPASLKAYITIHPYVFSRLVAAKIDEAKQNGQAVLVTAFHADEMIDGGRDWRLVHTGEHFVRNVRRLRREVSKARIALNFVTPGDIVRA